MSVMLGEGSSLITGKTGMGKSMLVAGEVMESLEQGKPLCYIDPKGETYDAILMLFFLTKKGKLLWEKNKHRILLLDLTNINDCILSFNAIELMEEFAHAKVDLLALTANNIVEHIRKLSGLQTGEAMRMQNTFLPAVSLLSVGGLTLAELPLLFVDTIGTDGKIEPLNPLVRRLLKQTTHYGTHMFWEQQWAKWNIRDRQNFVVSSEDRVFQYIFDERFLYTVCSTKNVTLDFAKVVNEGYWILARLPYPMLQSNVTTILGNLIISKLFYACMQRGYGGAPYLLILDEARFFNSGPVDMILDTAHNFGLDVTLIVQYLDQLNRTIDGRTDSHLLDSALAACRLITAFKCQRFEDRRLLAEVMFPLTGGNVKRLSNSGDVVTEELPLEESRNMRRLLTLDKREVFQYDTMSSKDQAEYLTTSDVPMIKPDYAKLDFFVGEHMRTIGRPAQLIYDEITKRQEELLKELPEESRGRARRQAPKPKPMQGISWSH